MAVSRYNYTVTAREAKNHYMREWRKKNPDKTRAAADRYWSKKAAELARQQAEDEKKEGAE